MFSSFPTQHGCSGQEYMLASALNYFGHVQASRGQIDEAIATLRHALEIGKCAESGTPLAQLADSIAHQLERKFQSTP